MPHPVIPQCRESGRGCVCVCVWRGGGGGAGQYKGVKKKRNYCKWGQYKVASGDLIHTGPGTAARRDIGHDHAGRDAPAAALIGLPCTATSTRWLDQQRRRYPKHTSAMGHVIFGWPANTEADHENPGGRGLRWRRHSPKLAARVRRWGSCCLNFGLGQRRQKGYWPRNDGQDRGQRYRHLYMAALLRHLCGGVGPS